MNNRDPAISRFRRICQADVHYNRRLRFDFLFLHPDLNIKETGIFLLFVFFFLPGFVLIPDNAHRTVIIGSIFFILRQDLPDLQLSAFRNSGILAVGQGNLISHSVEGGIVGFNVVFHRVFQHKIAEIGSRERKAGDLVFLTGYIQTVLFRDDFGQLIGSFFVRMNMIKHKADTIDRRFRVAKHHDRIVQLHVHNVFFRIGRIDRRNVKSSVAGKGFRFRPRGLSGFSSPEFRGSVFFSAGENPQ